jgi:hypothetical protein
MPVNLANWKAEIRRIMGPGQTGQKKFMRSISMGNKKLSVLAFACHPCYCGQSEIGSLRPYLQNNQSKKD